MTDATPPTVSGVPAEKVLNLVQGTVWLAPNSPLSPVTCADPEGSSSLTVRGSPVVMSAPGPYTLTYTCTDEAGNTATETVSVTVREEGVTDATPPTVSGLPADKAQSVVEGSAWIAPSVACIDPVDTSRPGSYALTYTCTDEAGNTATETVSVTVREEGVTDGTPPTVSGVPAEKAQSVVQVQKSRWDSGGAALSQSNPRVVRHPLCAATGSD